jgi:3-oxoacyl-(acyl-carrier-protein) synthase
MNKGHIASELKRFLGDVEKMYGITKEEIAHHGVYYSHETSTHSSPTSSCSFNEISALREVFGDNLLEKLMVTSTKGFTGHSMGCSFEDAAAIVGLQRQQVPPVVNHSETDETLGSLRLSKGGGFSHRYALRLGAGFGSQVAWVLYRK